MSMTAPIRLASSPSWFAELPEKLSAAVNAYDLPNTSDWKPLSALSAAARFEGIAVFGDSSVIEGKDMIAPGIVYVELPYDEGKKSSSFHETFPARIFYTVKDKTVKIKKIVVDVSTF